MDLNEFQWRYQGLSRVQQDITRLICRGREAQVIQSELNLTAAQYRAAVQKILRMTGAVTMHRLCYFIGRADGAGLPPGER